MVDDSPHPVIAKRTAVMMNIDIVASRVISGAATQQAADPHASHRQSNMRVLVVARCWSYSAAIVASLFPS